MKLATFTTGIALVAALGAPAAGADDQKMLELATTRGCFICHKVAPTAGATQPLAPAYQDVAARFKDDPKAHEYLVDRVLHGTAYRDQDWAGKVNMRFMPPNVNLGREEADHLVDWILHLKPAYNDKLVKYEKGLALAATSGCTICHEMNPLGKIRAVPLAPSFREIAAYYDGKPGARDNLRDSVKSGTLNKTKVWENINMRFMPPNVNVRNQDVATLVDWVLSLDHSGIHVHPSMDKTSSK
jgi:cytochrome c